MVGAPQARRTGRWEGGKLWEGVTWVVCCGLGGQAGRRVASHRRGSCRLCAMGWEGRREGGKLQEGVVQVVHCRLGGLAGRRVVSLGGGQDGRVVCCTMV